MTNLLNSDYDKIKKQNGLDKNDLDIFSNNLAISFKGYPLFETLSNHKYNAKKMKRFWKVSLKTISKESVFLTDSKQANSLAIFSPYQQGGISTWQYIKAGALSLIPTMGINMTKKMASFEKFAFKIKNKYAKEGCWYLFAFVTMPEFRGKGLGSKIVKLMLNYLDEHHHDCYLETLSPTNVEIYKRYGFELKEEVKVPNTDLILYAMLRPAK